MLASLSNKKVPMDQSDNKRCKKCDRDLPLSEFYSYTRKDSGKQYKATYCKECSRKVGSAYGYMYRAAGRRDDKKRFAREKELHPDTWRRDRRDYQLRRDYGITQADYDRMYAEQEGKCAICLKHFDLHASSRYKKLYVDHAHDMDKVRGLVCMKCNMAIGNFEDSHDNCLRAAQYLMKHNPHVQGLIRLKA
jgi:hypothetical protein